jgi:opacity protein-like surface antigen
MRKVLVTILAISFNTLVFASGDLFVKPTNYFDGFYVGVGGGVAHTTADANASMNTVVTQTGQQVSSTEEFPTALNADLGETSLAGEFFAGYGKSFNIKSNRNNFYLGLEIFGRIMPTDMGANTSNQLISANGSSYNSSLNAELGTLNNYPVSFSFGGDLRFGYLIFPKTMIYILAGVEAAPFNYMLVDSVSIPTSTEDVNYTLGWRSDLQWRGGFMPGVGIETMITDHWSLRAQYVDTFWGNGGGHYKIDNKEVNYQNINGTEDVAAYINGQLNNVQRGLFTIDLTYHF